MQCSLVKLAAHLRGGAGAGGVSRTAAAAARTPSAWESARSSGTTAPPPEDAYLLPPRPDLHSRVTRLRHQRQQRRTGGAGKNKWVTKCRARTNNSKNKSPIVSTASRPTQGLTRVAHTANRPDFGWHKPPGHYDRRDRFSVRCDHTFTTALKHKLAQPAPQESRRLRARAPRRPAAMHDRSS